MKVNELADWMRREFDFPVGRDAVIAAADGLEVEAPDQSDAESLETILRRSGESRFGTPVELLETVQGNLPDGYVGRKYYDDRGGNPADLAPGAVADESSQSF